jgi:hypothetical protein
MSRDTRTHPYVPALCGATLGRTSRATRTASPRPRDTRAIHIEVYGAGPDRAEARIESAFRCRGLPGHRLMRGHGLPGPCVRCRYHPGTEDPKTTIKPPSPLKSPIGGPPVHLRREVLYSSCRGLWGLGLPGKP